MPWRRPGFQLGLDIAAIKDANPQAVGTILGGHGITAWGDTSEEAEANSLWIIEQAEKYIADTAGPNPSEPKLPGYAALPEAERRAKAAALAPVIRGLASTDKPQSSGTSATTPPSWTSSKPPNTRALGALGTSCPDHFLRTKVKPLVLDLPADASVEDSVARLKELHAAYREDYQAYYDRHADAGLARPCAARTRRSSWSRAWACSPSARTSRPPGSPGSSTSTPST